MAEINNPQLKEFCNDVCRKRANVMLKLASQLPGLIAEYNARNLGTVIENAGAGELITDGSETDGKTRCTGGDVYNMITLMQDLTTFFTSGRIDVLAKWQTNAFPLE